MKEGVTGLKITSKGLVNFTKTLIKKNVITFISNFAASDEIKTSQYNPEWRIDKVPYAVHNDYGDNVNGTPISQSDYDNWKNDPASFWEKKANTKFEINYWGLGNKEALKFLFKNKKQSEKIKVRVASFTPLQYTYLILNKSEANSFSIVGTVDQNQEFVFTNYIFDKDPNFEKKYSISSNYDRIFTLKRGNVILNEIFERK